LLDSGYVVIPWISGSIGIGFNEAYRFTNMPTIFEALPTPDFANKGVAKWSFSPNDNIYIVCGYNQTAIQLTQALPANINR
ncbi:STY0301 family protein, partial [Legionella sp. 29fVS95]|uniref:STY0301 family protein n=1 Tax=Legionella sp. 29fVS95 TaxID=3402813 RepID=UPI003AF8A5F1